MLEMLVPTLWACFAIYTGWYLTSAKHYAPLTRTEAKTLWHIHRQNVQCNGKKCIEIRHRDQIIGFQCECGYRHMQKRPIMSKAPAYDIELRNPEYSTVDNFRTGYKSK